MRHQRGDCGATLVDARHNSMKRVNVFFSIQLRARMLEVEYCANVAVAPLAGKTPCSPGILHTAGAHRPCVTPAQRTRAALRIMDATSVKRCTGDG